MKLIDADKLVKAVEDLPNCYNGFSDTYDKACIIGLIDEQPTISPKTGRWYAVTKEMPEPGSRVLVYTVGYEYHVWDAMPNRPDNYCWEDEEGLYHDKWEAELWMPLPEV